MSWLAQLIAAAILLMAALPKLTSAADSVAMFSGLGVEPWGRFTVGALEAVAAALLLVPHPYLGRHTWGGALAALLMLGALGAHATKLGFGGAMAPMVVMALVTLGAGLLVVYLRRLEPAA